MSTYQREHDTNGADIKAIMDELRRQTRDLEEIKMSVSGSTKLGIKGLAKRMEVLESWKDNITLRVAYTSGLVSGITFGGLEGIKALIESLKHHTP